MGIFPKNIDNYNAKGLTEGSTNKHETGTSGREPYDNLAITLSCHMIDMHHNDTSLYLQFDI